MGQWDGREGKEVRRLFLAFFRVEFHSGAGGGDHQHAVVGPEYLVVDVVIGNFACTFFWQRKMDIFL